jgi:hypothetical protein
MTRGALTLFETFWKLNHFLYEISTKFVLEYGGILGVVGKPSMT